MSKEAVPYPVRHSVGVKLAYCIQCLKSDSGEDRMAFGTLSTSSGDQGSFVAVFDGHAGSRAAEFCSQQISSCLNENITNLPEDINAGVAQTCRQLNSMLLDRFPDDKSGTTFIILIAHKQKLYTSWVGDSEAYIFHSKDFHPLSAPVHDFADDIKERLREDLKKPEYEGYTILNSPAEFSEIKTKFQCWFSSNGKKLSVVPSDNVIKRYGGGFETSISVSRSIGDPRFGELLKPEPDSSATTILDNSIVIIGSDGLWDVIPPAEVQQRVRKLAGEILDDANVKLPQSEANIKATLKRLSQDIMAEALRRWGDGYRDDVSFFVCWFNPE